MDDGRYTYAVARIRALETKLFDRPQIERLLAEDSQGMLRLLKESDYAESFSEVGDPHDFEPALTRELDKVLSLLTKLSPDRELIDLFRLRYDYHNLKILLKAKYLDESGDGALMDLGMSGLASLKSMVQEGKYLGLIEPLKECFPGAVAAYERESDPREINLAVDRAMWEHFLRIADKYHCAFLKGLFQCTIDLINIKILLRIKGFESEKKVLERNLIPGGILEKGFFLQSYDEPWDAFLTQMAVTPYEYILTEGLKSWPEDKSFTQFEIACDRYIFRYLEKAKYVVFGIEPLIAYLVYKENEIKLIRTMMVGKLNGIDRETLEARLRVPY